MTIDIICTAHSHKSQGKKRNRQKKDEEEEEKLRKQIMVGRNERVKG